ncbi:Ig-like domain-containing protein [Brevibacillus fluminis]|uniref:Ig-like domain-containing protein n=1 Tax=Brevibacillus fluminis TaxID=511487 RepID=UPI003F899742
MRVFYSKGLVFALALIVLLLSGCVTSQSSVTFQFDDAGVYPQDLYVRHADGNVSKGETNDSLQKEITVATSGKPVVGGFLTDGTVSWVPDYSYNFDSIHSVHVSAASSQKPSKPADHVQLLSALPNQANPGYVDAKFAVYDADNQLVTGQAEVFAHSNPDVTFWNNDDKEQTVGSFYTKTDTVLEGFSSYTTNGSVTFVLRPNADFSLPPLALYSGQKLLYDSERPVTVSFDSNGGSEVSSETVSHYGTVTQPAAPTKNGYTFGGWYSDTGLTRLFDFNTPLRENTTLYAKWESVNAALSGLSVEQGTLEPAFSAANVRYDANVNHSVSSFTFSLTKGDPNQTITVTGATYQSATGNVYTYQANLVDGPNPIQITVDSENRAQHNTYLLTVNRAQAPSSNANLNRLTLSSGTLSPAFAAGQTAYTASVPNDVSAITITASAEDSDATLTVDGNALRSGQPSRAISLREGTTFIAIVVTAPDLTTKTYTIDVTRAHPSLPPLPAFYPVTGVSLDQAVLGLQAGGDSAVLHTTIHPSYATNQSVMWSSSNPQVATVSSNGVVTPLSPGTATITVTTVDQGKTATSTVTVSEEKKLVGLEASEKTILLKPNESKSITLYAVYSNGTKEDITNMKDVAYRSSSRTVVTAAQGVIKAGKKEGKATITLMYQSQKLTIPVQISKVDVAKLEVQPTELEIGTGEVKQLQLTATLSNKEKENVTEQATWSSSDPEVATIDQNGKLRAVAPGTAVITATYGGQTAELSVTISESIQVRRLLASKKKLTVAAGKDQAVRLTAYYVDGSKQTVTEQAEWSSDDEIIATVENGKIHGNVKGTVTIEATYQGKSVTITVTVTE